MVTHEGENGVDKSIGPDERAVEVDAERWPGGVEIGIRSGQKVLPYMNISRLPYAGYLQSIAVIHGAAKPSQSGQRHYYLFWEILRQ